MTRQEQDPDRCHELWNIQKEIKRQLERHWAEALQERENLNRLHAEHTEAFNNLVVLQAAQPVVNVGSLTRGAPGATAGIIDLVTSLNISNLEAKIRRMEIQIALSKEKIASIQSIIDRYEQNLKTNADEMRALDCIMPS